MPKIRESISVEAPQDIVFGVLTDYANYPDFQPDVTEARVHKHTATAALVSFTALIVQQIHYTLEFKLTRPAEISWKRVKGTHFIKANTGRWRLGRRAANLTDLELASEIEFPSWLPRSLTDGLIKKCVPSLLSGMKKRSETVYKYFLKKK